MRYLIEHEVEQNLKTVATKEDVYLLRNELEKGLKEQTRWMLGVFITLALMILGLYATILLK